jgi:hypothetical protein
MGLELKHRFGAAFAKPISREELERSIEEANRQVAEGTLKSIGEVMLYSGDLKAGERHFIHRFSRKTTPELADVNDESKMSITFSELFKAVRKELNDETEEDLSRAAVAVGDNLGCKVYLIASIDPNKTTLIVAMYPDGTEEIIEL